MRQDQISTSKSAFSKKQLKEHTIAIPLFSSVLLVLFKDLKNVIGLLNSRLLVQSRKLSLT